MKNRIKIKSKKGDISITLLVIMTFVLVVATLFSFALSSGGLKESMTNGKFLESMYTEGEIIGFYVQTEGERALIKSYSEMIDEKAFTGSDEGGENIVVFSEFMSEEVNSKLKSKIEKNFKDSIVNYNLAYNDILKEKTIINLDNDILSIKPKDIRIHAGVVIKGGGGTKVSWLLAVTSVVVSPATSIIVMALSPNQEKIKLLLGATYSPDMEIKISLNELGLSSFEEIYDSCEECLKQEKILECLSGKLKNFDIKLEKYKGIRDYDYITLTSKKKFFIDNEFKNIKIEFLM